MSNFRELEQQIIADGRVNRHDLELLRQRIYRDGKIDRQEADFLVVLYKRARKPSPAFRKFFYQAIKDHLLADHKISAGETAWLEQMLFHSERIEDEKRALLRELKGEASEVSPEFEALFERCMKLPTEQHTAR